MTAWLTGAGAAIPAAKVAPPGDQPCKSQLIIKLSGYHSSSREPGFRDQRVPGAAYPDQAWMFADADNGSVPIIGNTGQCLGLPTKAVPP